MSDDLVLLDLDADKFRGIPFTFGVKESGVDLLSDRFPTLKELAVHTRPDQKQVRYLAIGQGRHDPEPEANIDWIVFPTYEPEGDNQLAPISPSNALLKLTKNSALIRTVTRRQVGDLVTLLGRAQSFEIRVSSLEDATSELTALWGKPSPTGV